MIPPYLMVFDVESIGLHGEGFAVGWVVVDRAGNEVANGLEACAPHNARGSENSRLWVAANVPSIQPTRLNPRYVREAFWQAWRHWQPLGAILAADCAWPVEARFLNACVDDAPIDREWEGPYPLHDLASVLLVFGADPLAVTERLPSELPAHNPLCDARQSARQLLTALKSATRA